MKTTPRPQSARKAQKSAVTSAKASPSGFFATVRRLVAPRTGEGQRATRLLEAQHRQVEALFEAIESANGKREALVVELAQKLQAHMVIEEELFYPAASAFEPDLVLEGYEEHAIARFALERLLATSPTDRTFKAKVKALKELIEDHVQEEEKKVFPKVRRGMSRAAERALGAKLQRLFEETIKLETARGSGRRKPAPRGHRAHA